MGACVKNDGEKKKKSGPSNKQLRKKRSELVFPGINDGKFLRVLSETFFKNFIYFYLCMATMPRNISLIKIFMIAHHHCMDSVFGAIIAVFPSWIFSFMDW